MFLTAAFAGAGCSGGALGGADGGGATGGIGGVTGIGGTIGDSPGVAGSVGAGGAAAGGAAGAGLPCPDQPGVIGCGAIGALQLALAPNGGAFVSYLTNDFTWIKSRDAGAGGWKVLRQYPPNPFQRDWPPILGVDSQGRLVIASATQDDTGFTRISVGRWDGTRTEDLALAPPVEGGLNRLQLQIDAMDRPVLLVDGTSSSGSKLAVYRWEGATWMRLGGATPINATPSRFSRLALDSGDGVTPYVAYEPENDDMKIMALRFDGTSWSAFPALARGSHLTFDMAVAGGQIYLAYLDYLDVPQIYGAHIYLSTIGPSGWSSRTRLDADVDKNVVELRLVATGPGAQDLMLGWEVEIGTDMHQVYVKRAPAWSLVPRPSPLSGDMNGFAIATRGTRDAIVWWDRYGAPPFAGYLELPR